MDKADKYRKEFDVIFQEIGAREQLQRQAAGQPRAEFVCNLLANKRMKNFLETLSIPARKEVIDACLAAKFPSDPP